MDNSQCKKCVWYAGEGLSKYPKACERYDDIRSTITNNSSKCPYFWSHEDQKIFESFSGDTGTVKKKSGKADKGRSRDITAEALIKELTKGQGDVHYRLERADGRIHEVSMWGNSGMEDGLDHTLNVYISLDGIKGFSDSYIKKKYDTKDIDDPCNNDAGFMMTVELTDVAATATLAVEEGKMYTDLFERDGMRSFTKRLGSMEFDLDETGLIPTDQNTLAKMSSDKILAVLSFSMAGLRQYLLKKGIVQQLYDMYDSLAGVLVKVGANNRISTTIVRADKRPDLPCIIIPFGEQMFRPYMDETLGVKPKMKKRPKNNPNSLKNREAARLSLEKDDILKANGKKYTDFTVTDDLEELEQYIFVCDRLFEKELKKSNDAILKEKDTPVTRANDSRIKKTYTNTETVIAKHCEKLGEVLLKIDEIGARLKEEGASEEELMRVARLIGDGYEKLHFEARVEVYKEEKRFKAEIDKKYTSLSRKWKKIYNNLPSVKLVALKEELEKKEGELAPMGKEIGILKRKNTNLSNKVSALEEELQQNQESLNLAVNETEEIIASSEKEQEELKATIQSLTDEIAVLKERQLELKDNLLSVKSEYQENVTELKDALSKEKSALSALATERDALSSQERFKKERAEKAFLFKKKKQGEYEVIHKQLENLNEKVSQQQEIVKVKESALHEYEDSALKQIALLEREFEANDSLKQDKEKSLGEAKAQLTAERESVRPHKKRVEEARSAVNELNKTLKEKRNELAQVQEQLVLDEQKKDELTQEISEIKNQIKEIERAVVEASKVKKDTSVNDVDYEDKSDDYEESSEIDEIADVNMMKMMAITYLNGEAGVDKDPEQAAYWMEEAASAGDSEAQFNIGLFYAKGFGVKRDFAQMVEWMNKASENGDSDAARFLKDYGSMDGDLNKAKVGDAKAQAAVAAGFMKLGPIMEQAGSENDYKESVKWAAKAAEQNEGLGIWTLALAYEHGRGVEPDIKKAIELYKKGADIGDSSCKHNLGAQYISGENIERDAHKGFALIKEAAEEGDGQAMRSLGKCYQFARGTTGNMSKALEWYEKASERINDPELEQRVIAFKHMATIDPSFGEDYPENENYESGGSDSEDATEIIRKGLKNSGKAHDDAAIEGLSIEEAYEAYYAGMEPSDADKKKMKDFFSGKNFVLSGFDSFTEPPIRKIIEENGGIVRSSTVLDTDYLIYDERFGTDTKKQQRARELNLTKGKNIMIIPLKRFEQMIKMCDFEI